MNILDKIVAHKKQEVEKKRSFFPTQLLENSIYFETDVISLKKYVTRPDKYGIIAEFKRQSPSKGVIAASPSIEQISIGYMQANASALSVLTDEHFFGGKNEDLQTARKFNYCPILRKDFILNEYQVVEAKSIGADAVLLIAAVLTSDQVRSLASFAKTLGLEVLLEVHHERELDKLTKDVDLVGVNNRNLEDFTVSLETSIALAKHIPEEFVSISESGIRAPEDVHLLKSHGYEGFLIGELFMKTAVPHLACANFIQRCEAISNHIL